MPSILSANYGKLEVLPFPILICYGDSVDKNFMYQKIKVKLRTKGQRSFPQHVYS